MSAEVGRFLKTLRESQNLTQQEAADLTRGRPWQISRSAISAIERGRSLPSLEALIALGHVLHVEPAEVIERVERRLHPPAAVGRAGFDELMARGDELFWAGRFREALGLYDGLIAALPLDERGETATLRARCEVRRSTALRRAGMLHGAREAAERAIELAVESAELRAEGYVLLAACRRQTGQVTLALDASSRAVELSETAGGARLASRVLLQHGACLLQANRPDAARTALLEAYRAARHGGDTRQLPHIVGNVAMCWLRLGDRSRARLWLGKAVRLARRAGIRALEASWLVELGELELGAGRLERAEQLALAALRIARPREHWLTVFRAEWLGHRALRRRDPQAPDRHRLSHLKKLLRRLGRHEGDPSVEAFRRSLRRGADDPQRRPA